jgi:hypothetical protein
VVLALTNGGILMIVVLIVLPLAAIAFIGAGAALRQIGKGPFAIEQELPQRSSGVPLRPATKAEREAEVRQMLEAKSYRREARGEAPLDVDAEVERLIGGDEGGGSLGRDAELREEVRQLVVARNERRMRRGEQPLDVDTEVERQLRELESLGQ